MRVGIVGLGKMGILHAGIVNSIPDTHVTAVCEREAFLTKAARVLLPKSVALYKDHARMLANEELDAVYVTTPISTHVPVVLDLIGANSSLSLFVEKPLASSYDQARTACEAASRSRGVHMVGFQKRFSPVFQKARELILQNALGEPIFYRAYFFSSDVLREGHAWRFRKGTGGVLLDLAPHLLDILTWFFGEPSTITATTRRVYSSDVDDYVHAAMSHESGLQGHIDVCWSTSNFRLPEISIEVHGKNGMLTVKDDFVKISPGKVTGEGRIYYRQSLDTSVPFLLADAEYTMEDMAFLDAVRKGDRQQSNFDEAAKVNDIIDRILASAHERRR